MMLKETVMRAAIVILWTLIATGCAYVPTDTFVEALRVQLTARDGGAVYYGTLKRESPAVVKMTVEVDRRVYLGTFQLTSGNTTFGLYERYGPRDAAPKTAETLAHTNFSKAVLSSTDNRVLQCDFTDVGGTAAGGLCVDEAQRVYDVIFS
jgi:hypothetical protein